MSSNLILVSFIRSLSSIPLPHFPFLISPSPFPLPQFPFPIPHFPIQKSLNFPPYTLHSMVRCPVLGRQVPETGRQVPVRQEPGAHRQVPGKF